MAKADRSLMFMRLEDEQHTLALKLVLTYEAAIRGTTMAQAFLEMIQEAADLDSYPPELRDRMNSLREQIGDSIRHRGIQDALAASRSALKSA